MVFLSFCITKHTCVDSFRNNGATLVTEGIQIQIQMQTHKQIQIQIHIHVQRQKQIQMHPVGKLRDARARVSQSATSNACKQLLGCFAVIFSCFV